ncbi:TetR/AcrR family transcriptional regulator [Rhodonellum sp.]|uniref:TetR/AcrR family transcriptional regulator n=1 Tax=Rhodonellum sp. TaxID=2231180 RepID=UPI0027183ACF|nr:TetR/AcrR family transcriptional regulator [Rhodonellum sp.]MDO9552999.1 TetR/AcrR family transcriptional regulator [Rhodonellum sp.]
MESLFKKIRVDVNKNIYLKDPFSSDLGKVIVAKGIIMISELGLEQFTFKKLAGKVDCTESAIYRYFENKHKLLLFLMVWYWGYLEHNLIISTANLPDPKKRLKIALEILVNGPIYKVNDYIDPVSLKHLLTNEATKAFMTKEIDQEYQNGFFHYYHKIGNRIAAIITEINPDYEFPKALVSTVMGSGLMQSYYSEHLPGLTEIKNGDEKRTEFFQNMVFKTIENEY